MPTPKGYLINAELKEAIQDVVKRDRESRGPSLVRYDDSMDREEWLAPEVYVARTPAGGIPALVGVRITATTGTSEAAEKDAGQDDIPGVAECAIYKKVTSEDGRPRMEDMGITKEVYNLFDRIPGNDWAVIARDKDGTWWVIAAMTEGEEPGTGTGTVPPDYPLGCTLIEIPYKICLNQTTGTGTGSGSGAPQFTLTTEYRTIDLTKACDDPGRFVATRCETNEVDCCAPDPPPDPPPPPDYSSATHCCEEWPDTIHVQFNSATCECLYGLSFDLTRVPDIVTGDVWAGEVTICGTLSNVAFFCTGLTYNEGESFYVVHWQLAATGCEFVLNWDETYDALTDPLPFNCTFGYAHIPAITATFSCCDGSVDVTSVDISPGV